MRNIEVEIRSFITQKEYKSLILKLDKEAKFIDLIEEETIYLDGSKDIRLRSNNKSAFIILKEGKIHDRWRKELEIKCNLKDFGTLKKIFQKLGYKTEIKWFRKRRVYKLKDIKVFLDSTKGYGHIIELEKMAIQSQRKIVRRKLKNKLKSFGVKITPKKKFDAKFQYYKENWRRILKYK